MPLRTALLVVAAVASAAGLAPIRADRAAQDVTPIPYRGFTLSAGRCAVNDPRCASKGPKDWTAAETKTLKKAIDEILASQLGQDMVTRAQQRGAADLRRFALGLNDSSVPVPAIAAAWVRTIYSRGMESTGIDLYDRAFANPNARDLYSGKPGYLIVAAGLLHECLHAIDDLSGQPEFAKTAGFSMAGTRWRFGVKTAVDVALLTQFDSELERMEAAGDFLGQCRLNRRLALSMRPIRMPTIASIKNPAEAFAEIGTHLILDPRARRYLPRAIVVYFDTNVFHRPSRN